MGTAIQTQPAEILLGQPPTKAAKKSDSKSTPVDEMALAQLLSMGVEQRVAEEALRACCGNIEEALIMATSDITIGGAEVTSSTTNIDQSCSNSDNAEKSGSQAEQEVKPEAQQKQADKDSAYEEAR